jgi:hypothetical protein
LQSVRTPSIPFLERQTLLEAGQIANQADIARREGITRARVNQVMGMLRLTPAIQEQILFMSSVARRPSVSERMLRSINTITDHRVQLLEFQKVHV